MAIANDLARAVREHPAVREVEPIAPPAHAYTSHAHTAHPHTSRANTPRANSAPAYTAPAASPAAPDWSGREFRVVTEDFAEVAAGLPALVTAFDPLAAQWDRLSDHERYMVIVSGPIKIDLVFADVPRGFDPPWRIGPDTLAAVDAHFWDWSLWLVGKRRHGKPDRVLGELLKMSRHLLAPLGVQAVPADLEEAADRYVRVRDRLEERYGLRLPRRLEAEVLPLVRASYGDRYRPSGLTS